MWKKNGEEKDYHLLNIELVSYRPSHGAWGAEWPLSRWPIPNSSIDLDRICDATRVHHFTTESVWYKSQLPLRKRKRGQATFLPAFVSRPHLRSIDVRLCVKYEKKQLVPLSFPPLIFPSSKPSRRARRPARSVGLRQATRVPWPSVLPRPDQLNAPCGLLHRQRQ